MNLRARSCPTCHSVGPRGKVTPTFPRNPDGICQDPWHNNTPDGSVEMPFAQYAAHHQAGAEYMTNQHAKLPPHKDVEGVCIFEGVPADLKKPATDAEQPPSHVLVSSPNKPRPADPLVCDLADTLRRIEYNYQREGSGPGSRFEGRLLEDVQAEAMVREIVMQEANPHATPPRLLPGMLPPKMTVPGPFEVRCEDHGIILAFTVNSTVSLRALANEARRHWREKHQ